MLADELTAPEGGKWMRRAGVNVDAFAADVRRAARFDLDPSVIHAAHAVRESPIDTRARALNLCRLPFGACWFEWPGRTGGRYSKAASEARPAPRRLGALVLVDESCRRGTIDLAWVQDEDWTGGLNLCPLRVTFDWHEQPAPLADLRRRRSPEVIAASLRQEFGKRPDIARSSDAELAADHMRFGMIESPFWAEVLSTVGELAYSKIMTAAISDIEGEPDILRCMLMVLNSRNMTQAEYRPPPEKLNRQRAKSGKPPLLDTTTIRVRLSRAMQARATEGGADPRHPSRAHVVRGHFKIRKSGVWWWSPHVRGEPQPGAPDPTPAKYKVDA
jgi:hypothetical protein